MTTAGNSAPLVRLFAGAVAPGAAPGRRVRWSAAAAVAAAALALGAQPAWLHAKAHLAQLLLQQSWAQRDHHGHAPAPWPGADTYPVARLRAPRHGIDQIVLAGDSGRTLAFGPGWAEASAVPGSANGTTVVSAHRDTHFAFLRALQVGDVLSLSGGSGERSFRVSAMEVVDSRSHAIATDSGGARLLLVTCWPFDALQAGGPLRYLVTAEPV